MTQKRYAVAAVAAVALALAGCSGADSGQEDAGGDAGLTEMTKIVVGSLPIIDTAPLYIGIEQGFFEEENLEVETQEASGGAALLPAVVSGDYQFGFSEVASLLIASDKGLPIRIVAAGVATNGNPEPGMAYNEVLVAPDSSIAGIEELEGKRVATNSLTNINYVLVRDAIDAAGGDSSQVQFVEIPFPDQVNALISGQVDATVTPEPFHTIGLNQGAKPIFSTYDGAVDDMTVSAWFTNSQYAAENPEVVAAFQRAIKKSLQYAADNPDAVRQILLSYTQISPEIIDQLVLPGWPAALNRTSLEYVLKASERYGLVEGDVDLDALLGDTPVD